MERASPVCIIGVTLRKELFGTTPALGQWLRVGGRRFRVIGSWLIRYLFPAIPAHAPWWAVLAALTISLITGTVFSLLPARRAADLDPVHALSHR